MHHVLGVGAVLAKDERLWNERASREQFGEQRVFESLKDGADLRRDNDGAVEFLCGIGEVFVEPFPTAGARLLAAAGPRKSLFLAPAPVPYPPVHPHILIFLLSSLPLRALLCLFP